MKIIGQYERHLVRQLAKAEGAIEVLKSCSQTLRENGDGKAAEYLDGYRGAVEQRHMELRSRLARIGVSL